MQAYPDLDGWFFVGIWPLFLSAVPCLSGKKHVLPAVVKLWLLILSRKNYNISKRGLLVGLVGQKYWGWGCDSIQILYDYIVNNKGIS